MASSDDWFVVGVDFGSLSGRAVVVRVADGAAMAAAVTAYPHAVLTRTLPDGRTRLGADWALQVPADYVAVLREAVPAAVAASGVDPRRVIGLATDFTACTVLPTSEDGTPLCESPQFADRPHAYVKLWKHHAAQPQADRITDLAHSRGETWLSRYGGRISSEWAFPKALQVLEEDPEVYAATRHWVEAADWIVWQLTDRYLRNACAAGYKGMLQDGAHPGQDYLAALNPGFADFVSTRVERPVGRLGEAAGVLSARAAAWTGLPTGIAVAVGNVDAHVTAAAADALRPGRLVAIMGTSTCHVVNADTLVDVPGMCGVVDGGIVDGLWGYEAGQSGVGDIFGHFVDTAVPAGHAAAAAERGLGVHDYLSELAAAQQPGEHGLLALDWHSGNRSVLVDHDLSGLIVGLTLSTQPEDVYRALVEATAFGTRTIVETFRDAKVAVDELVVTGGLVKNRFLMQVYADVLDAPLSVVTGEQGPALGSAAHAAVAAGAFPDVPAAAAAMATVEPAVFTPDRAAGRVYDRLYDRYRTLHDHFGRGDDDDVMHTLRALRRTAVAR